MAEGEALLRLEPPELLLSALKPAEDGDGFVLRLQNPGNEASEARIELGFPVREAEACPLDEQADPSADAPALEPGWRALQARVPARAHYSLRLR